MSKRIFVAHTITASQGGSVIGVYPNYQSAKENLQAITRFTEHDTDWGHFIRVTELGVTFNNVLDLPRSDKYIIK